MKAGDRVRVKEWADIPAVFRPDGPSEGVVEYVGDDHVLVVVDGKAVPYKSGELEIVLRKEGLL